MGVLFYLQSGYQLQSLPYQGTGKRGDSTIQEDNATEKLSVKVKGATEELCYLLNLISIIFAIAKTIEKLSEFITMANITLVRHDHS